MKKLMAANWKMYKSVDQGVATAQELCALLDGQVSDDREVLVCTPCTMLGPVAEIFSQRPYCAVGAQNFYPAAQGAFTGEICPEQLLSLGCSWALVGHSERRHILGETDEFCARKVAFGLDAGLKIILCVGETIDERRAGQVEQVLERQLMVGLRDVVHNATAATLSIAYEPVWAIGTGEVAGPDEICAAHTFVRTTLCSLLPSCGAEVSILYGGSVKPDNTAAIISLDNVNGVLVGGASLHAGSFAQIVLA